MQGHSWNSFHSLAVLSYCACACSCFESSLSLVAYEAQFSYNMLYRYIHLFSYYSKIIDKIKLILSLY
jgi:hypothetical protein